jgi:UDP-glucuronate decarboxylase
MITKETERVLYISSGEIYGSDAPTPVSEEFVGKIDHELPRSAYPLAKIEAEKIGQEICVKYGIDFRIVRLFHSFGPGVRENDGRSFADFLWQCARGKEPILFSKGHDVRSFLYSEDAVAGMLTVFLKDQSTRPINVGSEQAVTILEFAKKVSELSGQKERVTFRLEEQEYQPEQET